ncbi:hypothetical protein SAMN05421753_104213 [Planctomicrobium piriforme]|uniref:Uncharacterized protein n=1 Tax=Planctomicrobium piriforme TaxID=1576369 RepID=A0A1I3EHB1_9PLAN|nr:hypothetical protein SAMN05421753_104213 [Planctomicrobium piriforme]
MYEIKKDIPYSKAKKSEFPFSEMEAGDCFDVPCGGDLPLSKIRNRLMSRLRVEKAATKRKYATRHIESEGVIRVWRLE